uniref:TPR_REGION domain-containing protein n=1 Tax=Caenorhabditis tropicalis TaxID=1561998 RepID=A0A1I7T6N9_9PELO
MSEAAIADKDLGNAAYKSKDFATALAHYDKAIELDPTNITFYNNKAAVYFEEKKFEECVQACEKAVEIGRETRADYKLIAKAMSRAGNAFQKQGDVEKALHWFQRSFFMHMDFDIRKKIDELSDEIFEPSGISFNESLKFLEEGKEHFQNKHYEEALNSFTKAAKCSFQLREALRLRASVYIQIKEHQAAQEDLDQIHQTFGGSGEMFWLKARVLFNIDEYERSIHAANLAHDLTPDEESEKEQLLIDAREKINSLHVLPPITTSLLPVLQNQYPLVHFDTFLLSNPVQIRVTVTKIPENWNRLVCEKQLRAICGENGRLFYVGMVEAGKFGFISDFRTKRISKTAAKNFYDLGYTVEFQNKEEIQVDPRFLCECGIVITGK